MTDTLLNDGLSTTTQSSSLAPNTAFPGEDTWHSGEASEDYDEDYYYDFLGGGEGAKEYLQNATDPTLTDSKPLPIVFNEGIDLHSLNITKLDFQPLAWNAQDAFTSKVLGRLYLVIPGALGGLLLGVMLWGVFTLVLRSMSVVKKKVTSDKSPKEELEGNTVEMGPVERGDYDSNPDGIQLAPGSPGGLLLEVKALSHIKKSSTIAEMESETTSSGIGKSKSDLADSDSSSFAESTESSSGNS